VVLGKGGEEGESARKRPVGPLAKELNSSRMFLLGKGESKKKNLGGNGKTARGSQAMKTRREVSGGKEDTKKKVNCHRKAKKHSKERRNVRPNVLSLLSGLRSVQWGEKDIMKKNPDEERLWGV